MRALVCMGASPKSLELQDVAIPETTRGTLKVRVDYVGICGTDLKIWKGEYTSGGFNPPVIIGHEFCGTVVEVGEGVTGFSRGDFVTAHPTFKSCETCEQCQSGRFYLCTDRMRLGFNVNGAMAEYVIISAHHAHKLPEWPDRRRGAIIEPLSVAVHAVGRAGDIAGRDVFVIGPGTIGYLVAVTAKIRGANVTIIGTQSDALRMRKMYNIGRLVTLDEVDSNSSHLGEVGFECSGTASGADLGLKLLPKRGMLVQVGTNSHLVTLRYMDVAYKELHVIGSMAAGYEDWEHAIELAPDVSIDALIASTFSLNEWNRAFQALHDGLGPKVLISIG